jgi:7-keto-8-aminopelargonate synthetase-like enzyme
VLNEPRIAVQVAEQLLQRGFLVGAIRPPTVPRGTSRLRVTLHSETPDEVVTNLAKTLGELVSIHQNE